MSYISGSIDIECPHCEAINEIDVDFSIYGLNESDSQLGYSDCEECGAELKYTVYMEVETYVSRIEVEKAPQNSEGEESSENYVSKDPNQLSLL